MRKAVAQVASKARGNNTNTNNNSSSSSSKRSREENGSTTSSSSSTTTSPKSSSSSSRGKDTTTNTLTSAAVKSHTKMTPDEAALAAKNYRLAKELSELRVRHREESKTVTKLTMENMILASKCREVILEAAHYKKQLEQQKSFMANLQRQQQNKSTTTVTAAPAATDQKAISEGVPVVSPVLVSSDDFEEDCRELSISKTESETSPVVLPITPLQSPPKTKKAVVDRSPTKPSVVPSSPINPHRFFPQSASPKITKAVYNEEFPGDITTVTPSRRTTFQRMGSFEELDYEDDTELDTNSSPIGAMGGTSSPDRNNSGVEKKAKVETGLTMSSLDAFEASFQTDIVRTFSTNERVSSSDEIYDPFANSPVKIDISAETPTVDKPYQVDSPPPSPLARKNGLPSDPPGVDKTSTRPPPIPSHKETNSSRVEAKKKTKTSSPVRSKTVSTQSTEAVSPNKVTSPKQVPSVPVPKVDQPVASESKGKSSPKSSLTEKVSTLQSKAALLLSSNPKVDKADTQMATVPPKVDSSSTKTPESSQIVEKAVVVQSKPVSQRQSSPETQVKPEAKKVSTVEHASAPPNTNHRVIAKESKPVSPLSVKKEGPISTDTKEVASIAVPEKPIVSIEKSTKPAEKKIEQPVPSENFSSPTVNHEKHSTDKSATTNGAVEKSTSAAKSTQKSPSMNTSSSLAHSSPSPSTDRHVLVTPSPNLVKSSVSNDSCKASSQNVKPQPEKLSFVSPSTPNDVHAKSQGHSLKRENESTRTMGAVGSYSAQRFANRVETSDKDNSENNTQSPSWVKRRSLEQDGSMQQPPLKTNGGGSGFPKTSSSFQTPIRMEESDSSDVIDSVNGNDSSSSIRSREMSLHSSSSPFRKTFGEMRPPWSQNAGNDGKQVCNSLPTTPIISGRSWQKTSNESFLSRSHDKESARVNSDRTLKVEQIESRPWQSAKAKASLAQQERSSDVISSIVSRHAHAASRSNMKKNGYNDQHKPFKPSMSIKELAAAFEARTPERSFTTFSDASTPSDEEIGDIPMFSPSRVDEIRKTLNTQFGQ